MSDDLQIYPVTGPEAWTFGQPSVAQWARREALAIVAAQDSRNRSLAELEELALRWARLIETGVADAADQPD
jgi:hypothetical protein